MYHCYDHPSVDVVNLLESFAELLRLQYQTFGELSGLISQRVEDQEVPLLHQISFAKLL
jgi:hypothetical protein